MSGKRGWDFRVGLPRNDVRVPTRDALRDDRACGRGRGQFRRIKVLLRMYCERSACGGRRGGCGPVCALAAETPPVCRRWFKPLSGRWLFPPKGIFVDHADRARRTTASDGSRGPDGVYSTFGVLLGPRRPLSGRAARSQRDGDRSRRWLSTTHPVRVSERAHSAPRAHGWYTPSRLKPFFACRGVPTASGWRARGWQIRVIGGPRDPTRPRRRGPWGSSKAVGGSSDIGARSE